VMRMDSERLEAVKLVESYLVVILCLVLVLVSISAYFQYKEAAAVCEKCVCPTFMVGENSSFEVVNGSILPVDEVVSRRGRVNLSLQGSFS